MVTDIATIFGPGLNLPEPVPESCSPDMVAYPSSVPDELVEDMDNLAPPMDASCSEKDNPTHQEEASLNMAKPNSESSGEKAGLSSILEEIVDNKAGAVCNDMTSSIPPVNVPSSDKDTVVNQEDDARVCSSHLPEECDGNNESVSVDNTCSIQPAGPGSDEMACLSLVPEGGGDGKKIQASEFDQQNQNEKEQAASVTSQQCPELSLYAKEQIRLVQEEIASLEKVSDSLELELQQVLKTKDCQEEVNGLTQDWLSIKKYSDEIIKRKQSLEILEKQNNIGECCSIIRNEIQFLFELEDWRKTAEQRANEQTLLKIMLSFSESSCQTGLKF